MISKLKQLSENILNYELGKFKDHIGTQKDYFLKFAEAVNLKVDINFESDCDYVNIKYNDILIVDNYKSTTGYGFLEDAEEDGTACEFIEYVLENLESIIYKKELELKESK